MRQKNLRKRLIDGFSYFQPWNIFQPPLVALGVRAAVTLQQIQGRQPGSFDTFNGIHSAINLSLCPVDSQDDRAAGAAQSTGCNRCCLGAAEDSDRVYFIDFLKTHAFLLSNRSFML